MLQKKYVSILFCLGLLALLPACLGSKKENKVDTTKTSIDVEEIIVEEISEQPVKF